MSAWPSTLPVPSAGSVSSEQLDGAIHSSIRNSVPIDRFRGIATPTEISYVIRLTSALKTTLEAFYETVAGALSFTWTDSITGIVQTARFLSRPTYTPLSGNEYTTSIKLELLP